MFSLEPQQMRDRKTNPTSLSRLHTPWCTSMRVACSTQAPTACTDTSQVHTCAVAWHVQLFEALWSGYRKERQKLETSLKALHVAHGGAHVDRPHNISVAHLVHIMSEPPNPQNTMEPKSKFVTRRSMSTLVFLKNWSSRTTTSSACPSLGSGCRSTKLHAHIYIYIYIYAGLEGLDRKVRLTGRSAEHGHACSQDREAVRGKMHKIYSQTGG